MGIFVSCFPPAVGKSLGKEWVSAIGDLVSLPLVATTEGPVDALENLSLKLPHSRPWE